MEHQVVCHVLREHIQIQQEQLHVNHVQVDNIRPRQDQQVVKIVQKDVMEIVLKQQVNVVHVLLDMDIRVEHVQNAQLDSILHWEVRKHVKAVEQQHIQQQLEHQVVNRVQDVHHVIQQQEFVLDVMLDMDIPVANVPHVQQEHSPKEVKQVVHHVTHHV